MVDIGQHFTLGRMTNQDSTIWYTQRGGNTEVAQLDLATGTPDVIATGGAAQPGNIETNGRFVIWDEWRAHGRNASSWRIMRFDTSTSEVSVLARGRSEWTGPLSGVGAKVAVGGDRVAYAIGAPSRTNEFASVIVVADIATGDVLHRIATDRIVWDLALSGEAIAYVVGDIDVPGGNVMFDLELLVQVEAGESEARSIGTDVIRVSMDDDLVVWDEHPHNDETGMLIDNRVMAAELPAMEPFVVSREAQTSYLSTAGAGYVAWTELGPDGASLMLSDLGGAPVAVARADVAFHASLGGNWLTWEVYGEVAPGHESFGLFGMPLPPSQGL